MILALLLMLALTPPPDSTEVLSESVVTAFRPPDKIIPAQTLQGERLERLNALSVADAIRYFSGVQIKDYGGIGGLKTINVRSMGTQHVGVFYDGIQLGNAQNGQIDLGKYSLENLESVTLYNGQKGTAVQSAKDYASASAVYLQSRTPVFSGRKRTNLKATLASGSFGTVNPSVLWEQKMGENVSSSLSAEYLYTTGRYKFTYSKRDGYDTTAVRQNGDVRALRVEQGFYGRIPDGNWRVKLYFYDSERGYPGAFVRQEPGKFRHEDRQWDTDFFTQGSLYKEWGDWHLNASFKYAYDYLHYLSDPRLDVSTMYVDNRYRQQEAYLSLAQSWDIFSWWDVDLAGDWQFNTLDADLVNFVYPSRHTLLTALSTSFRWTHLKLQGSLL
ncbi:MAG: TonB-dependent receptor plug domain-containing protein, partial [Bacteroidales bacterium]|nr:TonB-dependent receptor plug domain-containing protein [Bacteroidales bacterium]